MAVEDKYVDSLTVSGKATKPAFTGTGDEEVTMLATLEVAVADDDGSKYRLFKAIPSTYIPAEISVMCDAITGGTDYELGLYETNSGSVISKGLFMTGQTLATALTRATGHQLGLAAVDIANCKKTLAELSGQSRPSNVYDIVLTADTVGTAAGTVSVIAKFIKG